MNTVKDRLIAFIEYRGLSKNKFEKICGLSYRYVSNISKSIQPAMIEKISLKFPELNMGWIVTGEGEMLRASPQPEEKKDSETLTQELAEIIKRQQDTIYLLTEMLNRRQGETTPKKGAVGL